MENSANNIIIKHQKGQEKVGKFRIGGMWGIRSILLGFLPLLLSLFLIIIPAIRCCIIQV
jgi:hypothetical protein